jgi:hypothetical protein
MYWSRIATKPTLCELVMNVLGGCIINFDNLTSLEAVSMQVKALNSTLLPLTLTPQGFYKIDGDFFPRRDMHFSFR